MKAWGVPEKLPILQWATKYRYFSAEASALPGKYSTLHTPWVPFILDALFDKQVREVWLLKSAGVSHTEGILNNWLGWIIDNDPSGILGVFPKEELATKFVDEKFIPMIKATKRLHKKIDVFSRKKGNRSLYKKFQGGYLSLTSANVIANLQSTHLKRAFIEEPDRCVTNSSGQGSPFSSLRDRIKTYPDSKLLGGGSPGIKGLSVTEDEYLTGDQRQFYVPCHDCGESHVLHWNNVIWDNNSPEYHDIYEHNQPETAGYACPHCGSVWNNTQKNINVRKMTCQATKPFNGTASFYINALYSAFPGDTIQKLVERYLKAQKKSEEGDQSAMIVFVTTALGLPYEYKGDAPEETALIAREQPYKERTAPLRSLIMTAGIDIQSSGRIAIQIIAAGRGEELWVSYFDELHGNVTDKKDPIWDALEAFLTQSFQHESGKQLQLSAISFDSSDGNTSDNVYDFIRAFNRKHPRIPMMAVKGSSNDYGTKEIFSKPKTPIDTRGKQNTKSSRYGLRVFMVGTHKVKDLIYSRLKLTGQGAGRIHFYEGIRQDYYMQLLAEIKVPHKTARGKEEYRQKSGVPNEALDTLGYAIHALRSTGFHLYNEARYQKLEQDIMQANLFDDALPTVNEKQLAITQTETMPPKQNTAPRVIPMQNNHY